MSYALDDLPDTDDRETHFLRIESRASAGIRCAVVRGLTRGRVSLDGNRIGDLLMAREVIERQSVTRSWREEVADLLGPPTPPVGPPGRAPRPRRQ